MTRTTDRIDLPPTAELVRTSGFCSACDSRFTDELAYRFPAVDRPDGVALVEARHLRPEVRS